MLVGDLIMAVREAMTDNPPTIPAPTGLTLTPATVAGGTIPNGTYYIVATNVNLWGETSPCAEQSVTLTGGQNAITIQASQQTINGGRIYIGTSAGGEYLQFTTGQLSYAFNLTAMPVLQGYPPTRNTAYLPDQDGDAVSAFTMFRWINDALKLASQVCGGLLDYGGVGTVAGAPQVIAPGLWKKISSMWYDGYPLAMDDNGNYFRRNAITASVLSSVAVSTFNNQMMLEIWPQPSRSAALTQLAVALQIGQLTATVNSSANFLLTNGFVSINGEICSYSGLTGNVLSNLQRALGGTTQALQPIGSIVQELNLFWSGWREYAPNFLPGTSAQVVPVPLGWETNLFEYGLARMKLAEQNVGDYSKLNESFKKQMSDWYRANKVAVGPRQIGDQTSGLEVLPNLGGGWVIP